MDINLIEKLIKDMDESSLTKLSIEYEGVKISMEKDSFSARLIQDMNCSVQDSVEVKQQDSPVQSDREIKEACTYVTSPMVGTFYEAAGPDQAPYVKVGDYVKAGQVVCIIESMKLMNEIESDVDGEITAILVSDGDMVEYGQKIFEIRPR